MSIDKKAFGITEVHTPADLDESMVSRYATQVVLGSKLKEMLDGGDAEPTAEDTAGLDTLNLTEEPDDTQSEESTTEEPVTEDTIVEDTTTENIITEENITEEPVIEEPAPDDVIGDTQSNDQENSQSTDQENIQPVDQEEITVDEETV